MITMQSTIYITKLAYWKQCHYCVMPSVMYWPCVVACTSYMPCTSVMRTTRRAHNKSIMMATWWNKLMLFINEANLPSKPEELQHNRAAKWSTMTKWTNVVQNVNKHTGKWHIWKLEHHKWVRLNMWTEQNERQRIWLAQVQMGSLWWCRLRSGNGSASLHLMPNWIQLPTRKR